MHLSNLLLIFITLITHVSASPLALVARDTSQTQYNRTTTCLSSYFGGCCSIDQYGLYTGCKNATLAATNVPWTGMPTTQTANTWACLNPGADGQIKLAACCGWAWSYTDVTYENGVTVPVLQKSMACTASNAGVSKVRRGRAERGGPERRSGGVWW
ncbi:hypothetical protein CJF30_00006781 [Rutstroemia sp. NJR-2017a BBW]|nr:hypothetical protein CJF30_00006781 [Rutstroemia sp. NJR-2017a BBW]